MGALANLLSGFRLLAVPPLLVLSWTNRPTPFLVLLACALVSDLVDGTVARHASRPSILGPRLDSWADFATYLTVPLCAWWLWPKLLRTEAPFVLAFVAAYLVPTIIGLLKYRRITSYHTWMSKLSAVLVGSSGFFMFATGVTSPFEWTVPVLVLAGAEEVALTLLLPEWRANVPSFWHALKDGRLTQTGADRDE